MVLVVAARDGQYHLRGSDGLDDMWPGTQAGLPVGEDNWLAILCGTEFGPVEVTVHCLSSPPPAENGWEMIVERDLEVEDAIVIRELYVQDQPSTVPATPGWNRLRISVRARYEAASTAALLESPVEQHLIQLWPVTTWTESQIIAGPDRYGQNYLS